MRGGGGGGRQRSTMDPKTRIAVAGASSPYNPNRRDSDVSLNSSRPSSVGGRPNPSRNSSALLTDRGSQAAALRSINAYLSNSLSAPFSLRPPLPSARDITDALRLLLSRLDLDLSPPSSLDNDLLPILKHLGCPIKLTRSALRAPGTPHSWPPLVSLLHWLVELCQYADHQQVSDPSPPNPDNDLLAYTTRSYALYITGDDSAVEDLDSDYLSRAERHAAASASAVAALEKEASDLEARVRDLRSRPSRREELERERAVLAEDVRKFETVAEQWKGQVAATEGKLRDWAKELEAKERESERIKGENEELRRRVEGQAVSARDVERMRREMQAVERDIAEAEVGRSTMEERGWELEADIGHRVKDLEAMAEQCNQALKKYGSLALVI